MKAINVYILQFQRNEEIVEDKNHVNTDILPDNNIYLKI